MRRAMAAALPPFPLAHLPRPNSKLEILSFLPSTSLSSLFLVPRRRLFSTPLSFTRPLSATTLPSSPSLLPPKLQSPLLSPKTSATSVDLEPYLECSMPGKRLKVAVLLSGGVDSSVALRLLHAAGHSCTAFYLKIWFQEDFENFWAECPWDEDLTYARAVCEKINVPLEVVHLSDEYWNHVVAHIINEYRCGQTPNPDVLCNTRIKFGAFLEAIESMDFDYIASGHYAHVTHSSLDQMNGPSVLSLSKDMLPNLTANYRLKELILHNERYNPVSYKVKDQTYFLSHLSQFQLRRLIFPLGCILKDEVRQLARSMELPNKDRKDSQGICFLGKVRFSEFIAKHIGEREGILLEAETGDYLGNHRGFWFYTVGQRQGLRLPGGPWYVVDKDVQNNVVFVSRNYYSLNKRRRTFCVGSLKWVSGSPPGKKDQLRCKVRHGPSFHNCSITMGVGEGINEEVMTVHLSEDDQGLAAGQFAAFYHDEICIGSGVILDSWDDKSFPICTKALEIAQMKDKSILGKPVKIMNKETADCKR